MVVYAIKHRTNYNARKERTEGEVRTKIVPLTSAVLFVICYWEIATALKGLAMTR